MKKQTKQIIIASLFLVLALSFVSASLCDDITEQQDIPCEVQTTKITCSSDALITKTTNSSLNESKTMVLLDSGCSGSCIYNFSFDYNQLGSYTIDLCDGQYSVISVVEKTTLTNNIAVWGGVPDISGFATATPRQQIKIIGKALLEWGKELLFRFWWVLIVLVIFGMVYLKKAKNKVKKYVQQ